MAFARRNGHKIVFHGWLTREKTIEAIKRAKFLVFPSLCYEAFPVSIAEAYACGVPVIAPRLGAMGEIVQNGVTGLHFEAGDPEDLASKVEWAWTHPSDMEEMGCTARSEFEKKYQASKNYEMLMEIYHKAMSAENTIVPFTPFAARQ